MFFRLHGQDAAPLAGSGGWDGAGPWAGALSLPGAWEGICEPAGKQERSGLSQELSPRSKPGWDCPKVGRAQLAMAGCSGGVVPSPVCPVASEHLQATSAHGPAQGQGPPSLFTPDFVDLGVLLPFPVPGGKAQQSPPAAATSPLHPTTASLRCGFAVRGGGSPQDTSTLAPSPLQKPGAALRVCSSPPARHRNRSGVQGPGQRGGIPVSPVHTLPHGFWGQRPSLS